LREGQKSSKKFFQNEKNGEEIGGAGKKLGRRRPGEVVMGRAVTGWRRPQAALEKFLSILSLTHPHPGPPSSWEVGLSI